MTRGFPLVKRQNEYLPGLEILDHLVKMFICGRSKLLGVAAGAGTVDRRSYQGDQR